MGRDVTPDMRSLRRRVSELSPEKRAVFEKLAGSQMSKVSRSLPIRPRVGSGPAPLSFAQQRLWFLDQLMPGSTLFNLTFPCRIREPVDEAVLERSLNEIVRRHESLRTSFESSDGEPFQVIAPDLRIGLRSVDLRQVTDSDPEAEAARIISDENGYSFDLAKGPLLRATLLRVGETDYVFVVTMHHIVSDKWSMGVFWSELWAIWEAFACNAPCPLPELSLQYADFAVWEREWLEGDELARLVSYWKKQLAGLEVLRLPTDRPRPAVPSFRGAAHRVTIPASLVAKLRSLAQREGATLFMMLLAVFQTLLFRYSGQDDIAVGTFTANRNRAELEDLIGFFINTLVLRADFSGSPTFRELLAQVRGTALDAYAHQDLQFARLVQELSPERDLSRNPLFQVAFQLLNTPTTGPAEAEEEDEGLEAPRESAVLDLRLTAWESPEGLGLEIEYNTDLFEADTVERLARHYRVLLESVAANPDRRVHELPLLTGMEQRQLVEWNDTRVAYPDEAGIVSLFEAQVARSPDMTALRFEGEELSYDKLNRRANQLARNLVELGVRAETRVGVCADRSVGTVVGLLAILKAGGAYVPLNPAFPRDRLAYIVEDAGLGVLICDKRSLGSLPQDRAHIVKLEDLELADSEPGSNLGIKVRPDTLAYIIYTSGSTGKPKGVAVEHRQLLNRLYWMWDAYPFARDEVACHKTALSFVDSLWELLGSLLQGVPTAIIPEEVARDPGALVHALGEARASRIWLVPSLLRMLLAAHPDLGHRLPTLTFWVSSGEELSKELFDLFRGHHPGAVLYNLYGTSEVWDATWYDPRREDLPPSCVPIGRPIANTQAFILDPHLQMVPVGVPGELHIGGVGLARGYRNRPDLTAQKFIPHPFSVEPGARLYKTGDLARYRSDGTIEFLGRMDRQVKLRGFRIELGEVEATLARHPAVRDAAVLLREDHPGDPRIVGYVVLHQDQPAEGVSGLALRQFLRHTLPEYMVPSAFMTMTAFPLTASGKLDRRMLPPPDARRSVLANAYIAPRTPGEEQLGRIFGELLGVDRIGVHDNFFEMGGHSLLAIRAVSQMREAFNVEIPLRAIFESPTVAGLGQVIEIARLQGDTNQAPGIVPLSRAAHATTLLPGGELDLGVFHGEGTSR